MASLILIKCKSGLKDESIFILFVRRAIVAFGNKALAMFKCLVPALPAPTINIFLFQHRSRSRER
jgi:hypothetical protein